MEKSTSNHNPHIISVREQSEYCITAINYIQRQWPQVAPVIYEDCITHCIGTQAVLPQWYLLQKDKKIIGCSGLITNDFISRMDLYPWICALFIDEQYRGRGYAQLLLEKNKNECARLGFSNIYLATEHVGFYEKFGFDYIGQGYHPWGEESRIYTCAIV